MERPRAPSVEWIEVVSLKPNACECRACCLEPSFGGHPKPANEGQLKTGQ